MFNLASTRVTDVSNSTYAVSIKSADEFLARVGLIPKEGYMVMLNGYPCEIFAPNVFPARGSIYLYCVMGTCIRQEVAEIKISSTNSNEVVLTTVDVSVLNEIELLEILDDLNRVLFNQTP